MAFLTNIYPPILPDTLPAFLYNQDCVIPYTLSPNMKSGDVIRVQLSIVDIQTNKSVLDPNMWPAGIKNTLIWKVPEWKRLKTSYDYETVITINDLETKSFVRDKIYKVQVRFVSADLPQYALNEDNEKEYVVEKNARWLYENRGYFSQWSKPCLVKAIAKPVLKFAGFDDDRKVQKDFSIQLTEISASLTFETDNKNDDLSDNQECLDHYNIKLYQKNNLITPVYESEELYSNSEHLNNINYTFRYNLQPLKVYRVYITYTTNNLYTSSDYRDFKIIQSEILELDAHITATMDEDRGVAQIKIISENGKIFMGNITIRRTSSESNFTIWEDVWSDSVYMQGGLNYTWYDKTVQSGVWYQYCAQRRNINGDRGVIIQTRVPIMMVLQDMFLTNSEGQLRIRFNPSINEFKYNVQESQQIGLGAKYPQIKRNANNFYRSFPISGLISSFMDTTDWYDPHWNGEGEHTSIFHHYDEEEKNFNNDNEIGDFTTKRKIYGNYTQLYQNYNNNHNITEYDDYIYERNFREKVYDFLYKHNAKLFRSTTEGNILIKLINLDFQPVETLGRRLYSFTATAVEIDEPTLINLHKYKIQDLGSISMDPVIKNINMLGQIQGRFLSEKNVYNGKTVGQQSEYLIQQNLVQVIKERIANKQVSFLTQQDIQGYDTGHQQDQQSNYLYSLKKIKWIRIEFTSKPYLIWENAGKLYRVDTPQSEARARTFGFDKKTCANKIFSGYVVSINGKQVYIKGTVERRLANTYNGQDVINVFNRIINVGCFELNSDDIEVTNLQIKYPSTVMIDYIANVDIKYNTKNIPVSDSEIVKVGQLYDVFQPGEQLIRNIYIKHANIYIDKISGERKFERIKNLKGISIQAPVNTVALIKDSFDIDLYDQHIISNGFLNLQDDTVNIEGLQLSGIKLYEHNGIDSNVRETEFVESGLTYYSENDVQNPIQNYVYTISGSEVPRKIYYHGLWYNFTNENIVKCPVHANINYYFTLIRGHYNE